MPGSLDHMILAVNDRDESLQFYTEILGLPYTGEREMFAVVRASPECVLQLAPWGTPGGVHLAFSFSREDFDAAFFANSGGRPTGEAIEGGWQRLWSNGRDGNEGGEDFTSDVSKWERSS